MVSEEERVDMINVLGKQEGRRIYAAAVSDIETTVSRMLTLGGGAIQFTNATEILAFVAAMKTEFQSLVSK